MILFDERAHFTNSVAMRYTMYVTAPANRVTSLGYSNDFRPGWSLDPLMRNTTIQSPEHLVSVPRLFGWNHYPLPTRKVSVYEPHESEYDSGADWRRYGNAFSGFISVGHNPYQSHAFRSEGEVSHRNYAGTLGISGSSERLRSPSLNLPNVFGTIPNYHRPSCDNRVSVYVHPTFGDLRFKPMAGHYSAMGWYAKSDDLFRSLQAKTDEGGSLVVEDISGYSKTRFVYDNFDYNLSSPGSDFTLATLTYDMYVEAYNVREDPVYYVCAHTYRVTVSMRTQVTPKQNPAPIAPGEYDIGYEDMMDSHLIVNYRLIAADGQLPSDDCPWPTETCTIKPFDVKFGPSGYYPTRVEIYPDYGPDFIYDRVEGTRDLDLEIGNRSKRFFSPSSGDFLTSLGSWVNGNQYDIRSTAIFSSGDALTRNSISSNYLESLPELPEFLRVAGPPAKAVRALLKVLKGDVTYVPEFARELASSYLAYKYGAAPLPGDIKNLSRVIKNGVTKDLSGVDEFRGKFTFTVPNEYFSFGDGGLTITTRSKVVINGLSSFASFLLATGQGGISPTLSNLWDLVPFSFVVDWFTGLSDRLRDIDNTILLAAVSPVYFVHTYKIEYRPTAHELLVGKWSTRSAPVYRMFLRELSRFVPVPRETKIDFRHGNFGKNQILAAGSLLLVTAGKG